MFRHLLTSWSPNQYHHLREISVARLLRIVGITAALSVLLFIVLLLPALLQADNAVAGLAKTTTVRVDANMTQTMATYLAHNPDILVTTGEGDGFIVITPQGVTIKKFLFFGADTYHWNSLSSLQTMQVSNFLFKAAVFLVPSLLFWGALILFVVFMVLGILYTLITYFILHVRNYRINYVDLWKVTVYASMPSMMLFAVIPILRLGLPVAIVLGFLFVLWVVLSMLGTALFAEKHNAKKHP